MNLTEYAEKYDRKIVYEKHFETETGKEFFHHVIEGRK